MWSNKNYDDAIALVNREQPDIEVFLEAIPHWHPHLAALDSSYPYHICSEKMEMEVYSKLPLANHQLKLYGTYLGLIIADLKLGDRQ